MSPFYIACESILTTPTNLLWESSLFAFCFSCLMWNALKGLHVITVATKNKASSTQRNLIRMSKTTCKWSSENRPRNNHWSSIMLVNSKKWLSNLSFWIQYSIWLNQYHYSFDFIDFLNFFSQFLWTWTSAEFFKLYFCGSCVAVGFKSGQILLLVCLSIFS